MISRNFFTDIFFIIILVVFQVYVLNFIPQYSPIFFPVFIIFYPFHRNQYQFLLMSFLLGLAVDSFNGTWGMNALACTSLAFFRTIIFRSSTESSTDFFSFQSLGWSQFLLFIYTSIFLYILTVFLLEYFSFNNFLELLLDIFLTSLSSFALILAYVLFFKIKRRI